MPPGKSCGYFTPNHHILIVTPSWSDGKSELAIRRGVGKLISMVAPDAEAAAADTLEVSWAKQRRGRQTHTMNLLPHRRFTLETRLSPAEVVARLRGAVEPPKTFAFSRAERPLIGHVDGAAFEVIRAIRGRNSFIPRVRGTIEPAGGGSRITGTMRIHDLVIVFIGAFLLMAGSVFIRMAVDDLRSGRLDAPTLIPLGVLVFLTAMTLIGFVPETHRTLAELRHVVDASTAEMH